MNNKKTISIIMAFVFVLSFGLTVMPNVEAAGIPYNVGDVFCGVGAGLIKHFDSDGNLLDTLDTTSGSAETTGMAFDANDNLYCTLFTDSSMAKFDNMGNLITYPWGGPFSTHPESVVVDAAGNLYVGEVDGDSDVRKFDQTGTLLDTYDPLIEDRGLDWIDLAADQTTLFYTSEGYDVMRYDLDTKTQLPTFATLPERPAFALRIRQNGEVLVAATTHVYRLDSTGAIMQQYAAIDYGETSIWFALNLDPDGTSFWTAGYTSGDVYRIDIETGALIKTFNAGIEGSSLAGLAIFGEPTVAQIEITKDFRYTNVDWGYIYMDEDFSGDFPPIGWTTDEFYQSFTDYADGTIPEATLYWGDSDDYSYLMSPPFNTIGASNLMLEFKQYIDLYSPPGDTHFTAYSRAHDLDPWTIVDSWDNLDVYIYGPAIEMYDISYDIGSGTQVLFEFSGLAWQFDYWDIDDVKLYEMANLGGLLPYDDPFYLVDVVLAGKQDKVKSTNPGQLYGVITITGPVTNVVLWDWFDPEFDVNPAHYEGGIEVILVDPDGFVEVITDYPGLYGWVMNDVGPMAPYGNMGTAVAVINLDTAIGGVLPSGYKLMIYVKFKTAMKHQTWPDPLKNYTEYFYNQAYVYLDDDTVYFWDDYIAGYPPIDYSMATGAGIYLTEN